MGNVSSLKQRISKPGKRVTVELKDPDSGELYSVEIQELNLAQKSALYNSTGGMNEDGSPKNLEELTCKLAQLCSYEPMTTKRIFASSSEVASCGPHIDPLLQACLELFNPKEDDVKGKSAATDGTAPAISSPTP